MIHHCFAFVNKKIANPVEKTGFAICEAVGSETALHGNKNPQPPLMTL